LIASSIPNKDFVKLALVVPNKENAPIILYHQFWCFDTIFFKKYNHSLNILILNIYGWNFYNYNYFFFK